MPDNEQLRARYRPQEIRLLLIGESPPANETFFYRGDSRLHRYTEQAFRAAQNRSFQDSEAFLTAFCAAGCFLEDLSHVPLDGQPDGARRKARIDSEAILARRLRGVRPRAIVCVMKAIERNVRRSVAYAGLEAVPFHAVPFPAQGHQKRFVEETVPIIRTYC
jgi:hypothetical protein